MPLLLQCVGVQLQNNSTSLSHFIIKIHLISSSTDVGQRAYRNQCANTDLICRFNVCQIPAPKPIHSRCTNPMPWSMSMKHTHTPHDNWDHLIHHATKTTPTTWNHVQYNHTLSTHPPQHTPYPNAPITYSIHVDGQNYAGQMISVSQIYENPLSQTHVQCTNPAQTMCICVGTWGRAGEFSSPGIEAVSSTCLQP